VTVGTAPLAEGLRLEFEARYGIPILRNYGQTEFGTIAFERLGDVEAGRRPARSAGRIAPGAQVRIVGPDGREKASGEVGEMCVRGPSSMDGYLNGAGRAELEEADGWIRTGDLGFVDDDGFLTVAGRVRDVIICGGFNVYPAIVEAALNDLADVRESTVVGAPDDRLGEVPVAAVAVRDGVPLGLDDVRTELLRKLTPYEVPRALVSLPALPRLESGKIDRHAVLALFASGK
jgi:acyl-CoA synthetase (AMP-forming)/AMP-acid ligase II